MPKLILACITVLLCLNAKAEEASWEKVLSEGNTHAYISKDSKTGLTKCKVETITDATVDALVALNTDYQNLSQWMETAIRVERVKFNANNDYILHFYWDSPWPVEDRDSVTHSILTKQGDGTVILKFDNIDGLVEPQEDFVRIPMVDGIWAFKTQGNGKTHITYQTMVDPGGDIPVWLVNLQVSEIPFKSVLNMHKQLALDKYKTAIIDWL